jgi:tetratricopeptide (TPR) repeat protein
MVETRTGRACLRARAALRRGDARRAIDLADLGLNGAGADDDGAGLLCVRAAAQLALGRAEEAHASAVRALLHGRAGDAEAHGLAAAAAAVLRRHEDAAAGFAQAEALDPCRAEWPAGRARALLALGRHVQAARSAQVALSLAADNVDARLVLGELAMRAGDPDAAVRWLDPAANRAPTRADVRATLALALAASGQIERGLREYRWREQIPGWNPRPFDIPAWTGQPLPGRRLLVWDEQGLGDTIQFARFAADARGRGARVLFHGNPALCRLLGGMTGFDEVVPRHRPRPAADFHVSLMSLPGVLGIGAADLATRVPYLVVEPALRARWSARLAGRDQRPRVALVWQGNPAFCDDARRSLPLAQFLPLMRGLAGVCRFVSFQKGFGQDQLQLLPDDVDVDDLGTELDPRGDAIVDSAAALCSVDLLISADTALAHVAGALGRPVWVPLPRVPDWRWGMVATSTPWYPSMRLFRQTEAGDWTGPIGDMAAALSERWRSPGRSVPA